MKKLCALFLGLMLAACSKDPASQIKGNDYILLDAPEGMEISLSFDAEAPKFYGQAVNRYFGNYELNGDKIKFSAIGSTMMAAPEPMMKAETEYFKNLGNIETVSFEDGNLVLKGCDTTLKFEQVDPE